jgi:FkbM family methyltransferase
LSDRYWTPLLFSDYQYEEEIAWLLSIMAPDTDVFIDCGSNTGFWTVCASHLVPNVISVEASPTTFAELQKNLPNCNGNVRLHNAAVSSEADKIVQLAKQEARHGASFVLNSRPAWKGRYAQHASVEMVKTVQLDQLADNFSSMIIKLDVEGSETDALAGAAETLKKYPLLIYEDHSADHRCTVSRYVMDLSLEIFFYDNNLLKMNDILDIMRIKKRKGKGYNFFACSSESPFYRKLLNFL